MSTTPRAYSRLLHCLYDEPAPINKFSPHYSVFRGIDSRDIEFKHTETPRVHDFAVIWDDDHDERIIPVLEEILMSGLLPGIQFIGEHKGDLTIILAARTYWAIPDIDAYKEIIGKLSQASGDYWNVIVGMYDHGEGNLYRGHQCQFKEIIAASEEATHAYLFTIDSTWRLGTKEWDGILASDAKGKQNTFWGKSNRYKMGPELSRFVDPRLKAFPSMPPRPFPPVIPK